jgi:UDP-glucose 4-epimerase
VPVREDAPLAGTSPYGWSKLMNEQILRDLATADRDWSVILLRYFNPAGAHPSGLIGEDPAGIPNNLFPYVSKVALGLLPELQVFGSDYPTPDGTGIRDYIHVVDLALGHVRAIGYAQAHCGVEAVNLGTGSGYSVLEIAAAFARVSGRTVPCRVGPRRPGDVARSIADPGKAKQLFSWETRRGLEEMCADAWRWQQANPHGYSP